MSLINEQEAVDLIKGLSKGQKITLGFGPNHLELKGDQSKLEELRDEQELQAMRDFDIEN